MGKIRHVTLGDEEVEKQQKKRAEARRESKKLKKASPFVRQSRTTGDKSVGKSGERVSVVEGTDIKPEYKKLVDEVEKESNSKLKTQNSMTKKDKTRERSKRYQDMAKLVDKNTFYPLTDAVKLLKRTSLTKFDGTVELHINLKPEVLGDKNDKKDYRGSVSLPHGTGKQVKVIVADEAVISEVEAGKFNFDILVAHPSMMPKLAKVARVLGPKGLMPNPKNGTVTDNPEKRAKELSSGQVNFKTEPSNPIVHLTVGKVSFSDKQLEENAMAALDAVNKNKVLKATLTATMGPGVKVAVN